MVLSISARPVISWCHIAVCGPSYTPSGARATFRETTKAARRPRRTMNSRPIRFVHRGPSSGGRRPATRSRAGLAARGCALHRHQGRLRRGRLRCLHRGGGRARRQGALQPRPSTPASSSCPRWTARRCSRSKTCRRRRAAAPGAAGDGRLPRLAVRLLHAGLRDVAVGLPAAPPARPAPGRPASSWPTTWRATCAAAPATGRSWTPASACSSAGRAAGHGPVVAALQALAADPPLPTPQRLPRPAHAGRLRHAARRAAAGAAAGRRHRHRPVGQQAVPRAGRADLPSTEVAELQRIEVGRRRAAHRRGRVAGSRLGRAGRHWPRCASCGCASRRRRCAMPARWAATWPTARPSATRAGADGAGRAHRAAPGRRVREMPLTDFYTRLHEEPAAAGRVRAAWWCRCRRPARCCAPTRSASASTATSRRCARPSRSSCDGGIVRDARLAFGGMAATVQARRRGRSRAASASPGPRPRCRPPWPRWRRTSSR
jgi:hypothetical protein